MRHKIYLSPFQLRQLHQHTLQDPGSNINITKYQLNHLHEGINPAVFVYFSHLAPRGKKNRYNSIGPDFEKSFCLKSENRMWHMNE